MVTGDNLFIVFIYIYIGFYGELLGFVVCYYSTALPFLGRQISPGISS